MFVFDANNSGSHLAQPSCELSPGGEDRDIEREKLAIESESSQLDKSPHSLAEPSLSPDIDQVSIDTTVKKQDLDSIPRFTLGDSVSVQSSELISNPNTNRDHFTDSTDVDANADLTSSSVAVKGAKVSPSRLMRQNVSTSDMNPSSSSGRNGKRPKMSKRSSSRMFIGENFWL